jgi:pimeloyl-ACP methyl ester carboxylesterase
MTHDRPRLVLVHGLGSSSAIWRPVLPALDEVTDTLLVDLPGHGEEPWDGDPLDPASLAAHVGRRMDDHGWDQAHLLAHSPGGWAALEAAADGRAFSVTALAPAGLWWDIGRPPHPVITLNRAAAFWLAPVAPLLLHLQPLRAVAMHTGSARPGEVTYDDAMAAARAMARSSGFWPSLEGTRRHRFDRADEVAVPVTAVWGDRDRILPAHRAQARALLPRHAAWITVPDCGHTPQWDAPDVVVRHTLSTIRRSDRARLLRQGAGTGSTTLAG